MDHKSLASALLPLFENRPTQTAFVQQKEIGGYREINCQTFRTRCLRLSTYLSSQGVRPGTRVLILSENCPEWGIVALAVANLGATLVPIAAASTARELKNILDKANPVFCFFSNTTLAFKRSDHAKLPPYFAWDIQSNNSIEELEESQAVSILDPNGCVPDRVAILIYTSGTTGNPKGVPLTHNNIMVNSLDLVEAVEASEKDTMVSVLPMSHMLEFTCGFIQPSVMGIKVVYVKSMRGEDIMKAMQAYGCTIFLAVPLLFEVMARGIQQKINNAPSPIRSVLTYGQKVVLTRPWLGKKLLFPIHKVFGGKIRFFIAGGAKLQPWVFDFFASIGIPVVQGYGLSETSPVLAASSEVNCGRDHVGKPMERVELGLFDDHGNQVSNSEEGEICVRGPSIFSGYESEEDTNKAFRDGWFRTGDLGQFSEAGMLQITGRQKDIIVTPGGKNVYPEVIEAELGLAGGFLEYCILGVEDENGHEKVTAVVRPDMTKFRGVEENALPGVIRTAVLECCSDLSDYMRPQSIKIVTSEFPKTHTKKVKRHELRKMILSDAKETKAETTDNSLDVTDPLDRVVGETIAGIIGKSVSDLNRFDTLAGDLGIDSLTFVEVIGEVEKSFNITVDSLELSEIESLGNLLTSLEKIVEDAKGGKSRKKAAPWFSEFAPMSSLRFYWRIPRSIFNVILRAVLAVYCRITASGSEKIESKDSIVFTPNHCSHFDTVSLVATLPPSRLQKTFAVAAKDYFFNVGWKAFSARLFINAIPFDRKKRIEEGMITCKEVLNNGGSLIIFPEGTRSVSGKLDQFKPGVGRLVCGKRKVKAVPVFIEGAYQVMPKGGGFPKPGKVRVHYGQPISFASYEETPENCLMVAKRLQAEVLKLKNKVESDDH